MKKPSLLILDRSWGGLLGPRGKSDVGAGAGTSLAHGREVYRGFDGLWWPDPDAPVLPCWAEEDQDVLFRGPAPWDFRSTVVRYFLDRGRVRQWDLVGVLCLSSRPPRHEVLHSYGLEETAAGLRLEFLGFDVGVLGHECSHHSTILNEVMTRLLPELALFYGLLNSVRLLDDPRAAWELRDLRARLQADPARATRLEHYDEDERVEVVAIYGVSMGWAGWAHLRS